MNYLDLERAVDWIETRWGSSKAWVRWEQLEPDFAPFTAGSMMEALNTLFRSGHKFAPSPPELYKVVRETQRLRIERGEDPAERLACTSETHVWAGPWPSDDTNKQRCVMCGAVGGTHACAHHYVNNRCVWCPHSREPKQEEIEV